MEKKLVFNTLKKLTEYVDMEKIKDQKFAEKMFLKADIFASIAFIKEFYHYSKLSNIQYIELENDSFELDYTLEDIDDEESVILAYTLNKKRVTSISKIFENADPIEAEISKKYGIKFVN